MGFLGNLFGGKDNNAAQREAEEAARKQRELEDQRRAELAKQKADEENKTTRDAAKDRQRKQAAGATGARDTILTSPLGDTSDPQDKQKTILGA